jgi:hypothetical protein
MKANKSQNADHYDRQPGKRGLLPWNREYCRPQQKRILTAVRNKTKPKKITTDVDSMDFPALILEFNNRAAIVETPQFNL